MTDQANPSEQNAETYLDGVRIAREVEERSRCLRILGEDRAVHKKWQFLLIFLPGIALITILNSYPNHLDRSVLTFLTSFTVMGILYTLYEIRFMRRRLEAVISLLRIERDADS